jgi:molybdenum cofactor biosynthesis protein B
MGHTEHHQHAGRKSVQVRLAVVSTTRTEKTDTSGAVLRERLAAAGHPVSGLDFLPDDPDRVRTWILEKVQGGSDQALILSGGTGISARDGTFEAVQGLIDKPLPGFGELFRMLSFQEIGAAAMLSRATGGICQGVVIFSVPGSTAACRLAVDSLIGPELSHLVWELSKEAASSSVG